MKRKSSNTKTNIIRSRLGDWSSLSHTKETKFELNEKKSAQFN
jgi:hypothetical protein